MGDIFDKAFEKKLSGQTRHENQFKAPKRKGENKYAKDDHWDRFHAVADDKLSFEKLDEQKSAPLKKDRKDVDTDEELDKKIKRTTKSRLKDLEKQLEELEE